MLFRIREHRSRRVRNDARELAHVRLGCRRRTTCPHDVAEDQARQARVRHELEIEAVFERMTWRAAKAFGERFRITMLAARRNLRAAPHGVPRRVGPFDCCAVTHRSLLVHAAMTPRNLAEHVLERSCADEQLAPSFDLLDSGGPHAVDHGFRQWTRSPSPHR